MHGEIYIWLFFETVEKTQNRLKPDKNISTPHADRCTFMNTLRSVLLRMWNVSRRKSKTFCD